MRASKKAKLESAGWKVGSVREFLGLSHSEALLVEIKLALADELRRQRVRRDWTQARVARVLATSQSRVAKMESADASVSLDLLVRALLSLGASRKQVARAIYKPAA